jgi:hypothetical protein
MRSRWKKMYMLTNETKPGNEGDMQNKELETKQGNRASKFAWLALLFMFLMLASIFTGLVGFSILAFEGGNAALAIMLAGLIAFILSGILFQQMGRKASESGKEILKQHPNERFYKYKSNAKFACFMGALAKFVWLVGLIFFAGLFVFFLSLL